MKYSREWHGEGLTGWLKTKIVSIPFIADALNEAYRRGGIDSFPLAQKDVLETMRDDLDKRSDLLAEEKLAKLLSPIDPNKVLTFNEKTKQIYIGGILAEDIQLKNLKSEADALMSFALWELLCNSIKSLAEKALFIEGDNLDTMKKGRTMLFTLSTQKKILDTLRSIR